MESEIKYEASYEPLISNFTDLSPEIADKIRRDSRALEIVSNIGDRLMKFYQAEQKSVVIFYVRDFDGFLMMHLNVDALFRPILNTLIKFNSEGNKLEPVNRKALERSCPLLDSLIGDEGADILRFSNSENITMNFSIGVFEQMDESVMEEIIGAACFMLSALRSVAKELVKADDIPAEAKDVARLYFRTLARYDGDE